MRFPDDNFIEADNSQAFSIHRKLSDIIQSILQCHASGIHFREWNAGSALDHAMRQEGFQIDIVLDSKTGFLIGGNEWNCGTWQDKMGDSEKANINGKPATPRDGAPVEITGMLKSTLRWLIKLNSNKQYTYEGVNIMDKDNQTKILSFVEWNNLIQTSFEKHYYIPEGENIM